MCYLDHSLLDQNAHIISLGGDIYIVAKNTEPDYFQKDETITNTYCQSKLACMWWASELARKYPDLSVNIVHPGVVASGFGGENNNPLRRALRRFLMISPKQGAQTTLICATQEDIVKGGYYHNTMGRIVLASDDPGVDVKRATEFWNLLEGITRNCNL